MQIRLKERASLTYGTFAAFSKVIALICLIFPAAAGADPVRLLAFGDSLTAGYGLPRAEGFVPQLEAWLRAEGRDVTVSNAGVSGDTTAGGLARIDWALNPDVDAMILTLGGNDILRGLSPVLTRKNLDQMLAKAEAAGVPVLLVGLLASRNYGSDYKAAFDMIHSDLAEKYGVLYERNFFQGLIGDDGDPSKYLRWMQGDGIHPNAEGVGRIVNRLGPRVIELLDQVE